MNCFSKSFVFFLQVFIPASQPGRDGCGQAEVGYYHQVCTFCAYTCTFCTFHWAGDPAPRTPCRRASSPCAWRSRAASVSWTHSDHIGTFCSEPGVFVVRGIYFPLTVWHWNTRKLGEREQVKNEIKGDERNKFPRSQLKVHGKKFRENYERFHRFQLHYIYF